MTTGREKQAIIRKSQLARIHIAKQQLDLDEATYRAMLERVTGKRSSAQMNNWQRGQVLKELARLGFKAEKTSRIHEGRPKDTDEVPQLRKIQALLADSNRPWSYAHTLAKKICGVARLEFCRADQRGKIIAALEIDANRRGKAKQ